MTFLERARPPLAALRGFLGRADVQRWLPRRKVWVGALAGLLVQGGEVLGVLGFLPDGWAVAAAYAIGAYLVPEAKEPRPVGPSPEAITGEELEEARGTWLPSYELLVVGEDPLTDPDGPGLV